MTSFYKLLYIRNQKTGKFEKVKNEVIYNWLENLEPVEEVVRGGTTIKNL